MSRSRHRHRRRPLLYASVLAMASVGSVCCFQPHSIASTVGRLLHNVEGWVARRKVNADVNDTVAKYPVGPDAAYGYAIADPNVDHSLWDGVLRRHVSPGKVDGITTNVVDYIALAADADVARYRRVLASVSVTDLDPVPNELLALYVNAYNCFCIGHVTRYLEEHGTLPASVTDATPPADRGTEVWDVAAGDIGGATLSLNDIEHKILRSRWDEPRVHASIVCASASCPDLRAEAYAPHRLNEQMDDQARRWVGDATKGVRVDEEQTLSRIFLWFEGDFAASGGPVAWAKRFSEGGAGLSERRELNYFAYNWKLNKK